MKPFFDPCNQLLQGSKLGFKNLTLGFFDGKSLTPLDFTLQVEKPLKKARHRKKSGGTPICWSKTHQGMTVSKITNGLDMLKRALKQGFQANYVLVDSWFSSHECFMDSMAQCSVLKAVLML